MLLSPIPLEIPPSIGHITSICCCNNGDNLYVGTSSGQLLHFHQFEDASTYFLIMVTNVSDHPMGGKMPSGVKKLMFLANSQRLLVLLHSGVLAFYSLPELAPWPSVRMGHINDVCKLRVQNPLANSGAEDLILTFTASKIRVVSVGETVKPLKDIGYAGLIKGVLLVGLSQNYSNLVLVANKKSYDIIDLQKTRKIPMGEYGGGVEPFIVEYRAEDANGKDEYMLTFKLEGESAMVMFVDLLGDATRGTMMMHGYPLSVAVKWPRVYSIVGDEMVVYLLELLNEVERRLVVSMEGGEVKEADQSNENDDVGEGNAKDDGDGENEGVDRGNRGGDGEGEIRESNREMVVEDSERNTEGIGETGPKDGDEEIPEKKGNVENTEMEIKEGGDFLGGPTEEGGEETIGKEISGEGRIAKQTTDEESKGKQTIYEEISRKRTTNEEITGKDTTKGAATGKETIDDGKDTETNKSINDQDTPRDTKNTPTITPTVTSSVPTTAPIAPICISVDSLPYIANDLLSKVDLVSGKSHPAPLTKDYANIAIILNNSLWAVAEPSEFDAIISNLSTTGDNLDRLRGTHHDYALQLVVVSMLHQQQYDKVKGYLTRIKAGKLVVNPLLVIYAAGVGTIHGNSTDFGNLVAAEPPLPVFKGVRQIITTLQPFPINETSISFLLKYLRQVYKIIPDSVVVRLGIYHLLTTDDDEWVASDHWGESPDIDRRCICVLEQKQYHQCLMSVYDRLGEMDHFCEVAISQLPLELVVESILQRVAEITNEDTYLKVLVEVLKVDKHRGYQYLKQNDKRHRATNQQIMLRLAGDDHQLQIVRVQYMEELVNDAIISGDTTAINDTAAELFHHLIKLIHHQWTSDEETPMLFQTLVATYRIDQAVTEPWPKLSWPAFVQLQQINAKNPEYLAWYVKALSLYHHLLHRHVHLDQLPDEPVFEYFHATTVEALLEYCDYSLAEHLAVYGGIDPPDVYNLGATTDGASPDLKLLGDILTHYLRLTPHTYLIPHYVGTYGLIFEARDLLNMLPDDLSLVHVGEYLEKLVVDHGITSRARAVRKQLAKADARETGALLVRMTDDRQ